MSRPDSLDLGPCCCCGGTEGVRNIISLPRKSPTPGKGWGCVVCHLPCDGATYVACDRCVAENQPPLMVCAGWLKSKQRASIAALSDEVFDHDMAYHPEAQDDPR